MKERKRTVKVDPPLKGQETKKRVEKKARNFFSRLLEKFFKKSQTQSFFTRIHSHTRTHTFMQQMMKKKSMTGYRIDNDSYRLKQNARAQFYIQMHQHIQHTLF